MGDSGYHMEAQRKARILKKKNESLQQQQWGNFNAATFAPTVGDCLQMQETSGPVSLGSGRSYLFNKIDVYDDAFRTSPLTMLGQQNQQLQVPPLYVGQRSFGTEGHSDRSSVSSTGRRSTGLRMATPLQGGRASQLQSSPMTACSSRQPQTPGLDELLCQRPVYSTDIFPEYEDDRELFDTYTYI